MSSRTKQRYSAIIAQAKRMQDLSSQDKMQTFFDLQNTASNFYWQGLQARFPNKNFEELKEIALLEAKRYVQLKKNLRSII